MPSDLSLWPAGDPLLHEVWAHSLDAMALSDQAGVVLLANPAYFQLYGYTPEEVVGHDFALIFPAAEREAARAAYGSIFAAGQAIERMEANICRGDGTTRIVETRASFFERAGRRYMLSVIRDITDLRRLEDERLRLAAALEATPDLVALSNPLGHVLYLNVAGRQLVGLAPEAELSGLHMRELFHPSIHAAMEAVAVPAAGHEGIWRGESLIRAHDGRAIPVALVIIRHTDAGGRVSHFSTMARDISGYRTAEAALAELNRSLETRVAERTAQLGETVQELLEEVSTRQAIQAELQQVLRLQRAILDSASYAIIATRLDGVIRSFNPAAEQMLGYKADEVIGRLSIISFHDPEELRARNEDLGRILGVGLDLNRGLLRPVVIGEQPYEAEWTYRRADGSTLPVSVSLTTLRDDSGQPEGFLAVVSDISQRRAAEEALRQANADLARVARLKDEFLANMSHELRTPLNSILGRSEMLLEQVFGPLNERQLRSLHNIEESGRDLLALINDVLDVAKIESGRMELQLDVCDVAMVCNASLRMVSETALKKQITLSSQLDGDVRTIVVDQRRLKQILVNLLSNAVKFTPVGGQIGFEVQGDKGAGEVRFMIWDTGIGIAPEDQPRLFQPFVQIDSSLSRQYAGTGLGLSLVDRLAHLHGGRVELTSALGQGSRFTVVIPWRISRPISEAPPGLEYTGPRDEGLLGNAVILVVDDNTANRELLREYLESRDYVVATAQSGSEALILAPMISPDLIIMDIQMPGMDGIEAIQRLRASPATARLPIIALTALAMVGDRERCLAAGASEYVSRPVALKDLIVIIGRQLAQVRGAR